MASASEGAARPDLRHEVIAVLLEPALTLACIARVSLPDLVSLVRGTYVRVGRRRGLSVRGMAKRFGVAPNTVQAIANETKAHGPLGNLGDKIAHRRAVVELLTERGEMRARDVAAAIPICKRSQVDEALAFLVDDGMVCRARGRVKLSRHHLCIARGDQSHRLDSLRQFLEAHTQVVYRRFFATASDAVAYARVFTFGVKRTELEALREETYLRLSSLVRNADLSTSPEDPDHTSASATLVFVETPTDAFFRSCKRDSE